MRGKCRTQEERAYVKWRKGNIPAAIEISLCLHGVCTIMVRPKYKNFEIPWVSCQFIWQMHSEKHPRWQAVYKSLVH